MTPLSTLPTNARFKTSDGERRKLLATAWNQLRENPDHWLNGISPQVERRADVVYVVDASGVLSLMEPASLVEPVPEPPPVSEYAYRVTVERINMRDVFGSESLDTVRRIIRMFGQYADGHYVAIEHVHSGQHINADGSLCREQGKGLQFRAVEVRCQIGSISL